MPVAPPSAEQIPIEIADGETIVRVAFAPFNFKKKGKVHRNIFFPRAGESSVSVMRQAMGDDFCKDKAVEIAGKSNKEYEGLLTIQARQIRATGSTVEDSRKEFLGHADLDHGFSMPARDEPPPTPEELERRNDRCDALLAASRYHLDMAKTESGWKGQPLKIASL